MGIQFCKLLFLSLILFSHILNAEEKTKKNSTYERGKILASRFGEQKKRELIKKAHNIPNELNSLVVNQEHLANTLRDRLIQYFDSLGTRKNEPLNLNILGLPGVGKSSIVTILKKLGFPVVRIDAQSYPGGDNNGSEFKLKYELETLHAQNRVQAGNPLILFIDEIDKTPEVKHNGSEQTQPIIKTLNQMLTDGKVLGTNNATGELDFSNVFIITAMNFAPLQVEKFSQEIIGQDKSFWDFNEKDLEKLDQWLVSEQGTNKASIAKMLALLFRPNTISRMISDAVVAKPLYGEAFDKVVRLNIESAIARLTGGQQKETRLEVKYTERFLKAIRKKAVYAPSGARTAVRIPELVVEQLIFYAVQAYGNDPRTLATPKIIHLDFNQRKNQAEVRITPLFQVKGSLQEGDSYKINVKFDNSTGAFDIPSELNLGLPDDITKDLDSYMQVEHEKAPTKKAILEHRKKLVHSNNIGLAKALNSVVFDLEYLTDALEKDIITYLDAQELNNPMFSVIAGFPGNAKTFIVMKISEFLKLPLVKVNLQEYSGSSQEDAARFGQDLFSKIQQAVQKSPTGEYILLFEELDKVHEIDPLQGHIVNRPIMAVVKDLLNEGHRTVTIKQNWGGDEYKVLDIRNAYTYVTMNFGVERFDDIIADPRMTTIEDMIGYWRKIIKTPESLRSMLSTMFLPETVNRLMANRFYVTKPPDKHAYRNIIKRELNTLNQELFLNSKNEKNVAGLRIVLSKNYIDNYLLQEAVIPSEGGRQSAQTVNTILRRDMLKALREAIKNPILKNNTALITLDYVPRSKKGPATIKASAKLTDPKSMKVISGAKKHNLFTAEVKLRFPSVEEFGEMSLSRILVSGHEFGHAMAFVLTGNRFEYVMGVSPIPNAKGLVKSRDINTFNSGKLISDLMVAVGSRAMERVMLAENPTDPMSMLDSSQGPGGDIEMATETLWSIIYQLGMDPMGGVIDRMGLGGSHHNEVDQRRVYFSELPNERIEQLGFILRDLEDLMVHLFLQTHDKDWYIEKIIQLAAKGSMEESEFYKLIDYPFPGENNFFFGEELKLHPLIVSKTPKEPASVVEAREFIQGSSQRTAMQTLKLVRSYLQESIVKHLHADVDPDKFSANRCAKALEVKN